MFPLVGTPFNGILEDPTGTEELMIFYQDDEDPTDFATTTSTSTPPKPKGRGK